MSQRLGWGRGSIDGRSARRVVWLGVLVLLLAACVLAAPAGAATRPTSPAMRTLDARDAGPPVSDGARYVLLQPTAMSLDIYDSQTHTRRPGPAGCVPLDATVGTALVACGEASPTDSTANLRLMNPATGAVRALPFIRNGTRRPYDLIGRYWLAAEYEACTTPPFDPSEGTDPPPPDCNPAVAFLNRGDGRYRTEDRSVLTAPPEELARRLDSPTLRDPSGINQGSPAGRSGLLALRVGRGPLRTLDRCEVCAPLRYSSGLLTWATDGTGKHSVARPGTTLVKAYVVRTRRRYLWRVPYTESEQADKRLLHVEHTASEVIFGLPHVAARHSADYYRVTIARWRP